MGLIDRYALRLTFWPMVGAIAVTLISLLLERVLRLLDLLSGSSNRFGFITELAVNLVPHYLGLTLPVAFFVALFVVIARLNTDSEVDALLASGVSLTRMAAPYVGLSLLLAGLSLFLFGFAQPYSRYAYRTVLHAAEQAGWSGQVQGGMIISPGDGLTMTANSADVAGMRLSGVFIRRLDATGREEVTSATSGQLSLDPGGKTVTLALKDGLQLRNSRRGAASVIAFQSFTVRLPLSGAAKLMRDRGGDERELTLAELAHEAGQPNPVIPRQTLLAELLGRLARALSLPLLPLLALPLGLATKRGGRAPGIIAAGLLLLGFNQFLQLGQSLAENGRAPAILAIGLPYAIFAAICIGTFVTSRDRPGETPVGRLVEEAAELAFQIRRWAMGGEKTPA